MERKLAAKATLVIEEYDDGTLEQTLDYSECDAVTLVDIIAKKAFIAAREYSQRLHDAHLIPNRED